jgi:MoaA/NifB/PqqE/SkfB family radical SAM enzyme
VNRSTGKPGLLVSQALAAWRSILTGSTPMLSIEITRECPLTCPGCYAYGDNHLGGAATLRHLSDYRGTELVDKIVALVRRHRPLHVSLVGGEPLVRHRELSRLLPILSEMKVHTMVVTSAVLPIPREWMSIPRVRVAVSVDGLPEHHDVRRKPATYERILHNIAGCEVNVHWTITRPMVQRPGYLEEFLAFWDARTEVVRMWVSLYTPQKDEHAPEILTPPERREVAEELARLQPRYNKLLMNAGIARAIEEPPSTPNDCMFSKLSTNYSADLGTRVEPCIFGGAPDCSQCGCAISSGLHWLSGVRASHLVKIGTLVNVSVAVGSLVGSFRQDYAEHPRWARKPPMSAHDLVQIGRPEASNQSRRD